MTAPVVGLDYEAMEQVAGRFRAEAERSQDLHERVGRVFAALVPRGWQGDAADSFAAEMDGDVLPTIARLGETFAAADAATRALISVLGQAEEEAAALFRAQPFGLEGGGSGGGSGGGPGGVPGMLAAAVAATAYAAVDAQMPVGAGRPFGMSMPVGAAPAAEAPAPDPGFSLNQQQIDGLDAGARRGDLVVGSGQCVALAQNHVNVGSTKDWKPGAKLTDGGELTPGTVIATFNEDGKYPSKPTGNHAAIFKEYERNAKGEVTGIVVYEQWGGQTVRQKTLPVATPEQLAAEQTRQRAKTNSAGMAVKYANEYYVVTNPSLKPKP
ncbi:MAG TPA: BPSL0067 family protein [Herpetosiphonaceae bacterium]